MIKKNRDDNRGEMGRQGGRGREKSKEWQTRGERKIGKLRRKDKMGE